MKASPHESLDLGKVLKLIRGRAGLTFPEVRQHEISAGIRRVMEKYAIDDIDQLSERLETDGNVFDAVISEITVGETYFFRDSAQLDAIRDTVLPSLLCDRGPAHPIKIWSAGCSTGEEAYSLLILMEEEGLGDRIEILATDISRAALQKAREAEYGPWSFRNDSRISSRFFRRRSNRYQLHEIFRERVRFTFLNLASNAYPSVANGTAGTDLIVCRNVLIYFDGPSVRRTAQRFFESLAEGGWLILGPSDPPLWDYAPFETVITPGGVLYRRQADSPVSNPRLAGPQQLASTRLRNAAAQQDQLAEAEAAYAAGDHRRAVQLTKGSDSPDENVPRIRSLADIGEMEAALRAAEKAIDKDPFSPHLHYLQGVLFIACAQDQKAVVALRRSIYLDSTFIAPLLTLASLLQRTDKAAALRAFKSARALCADRPPEEIVPFTSGESAGRLVEAAQEQINRLSALITADS
jgi:chemotaxis protein methyltransferase CheR